MKTSIKKIALIIFVSSLVGLIVNQIKPDGISLTREKIELNWASDSLTSLNTDTLKSDIETQTKNEDEEKNDPRNKDLVEEQENPNPTTKELSTEEKNSDSEINKIKEMNSEVEIAQEPLAIKLDQAYDLYNQGVVFVDAREDYEYNDGHILNAINIPYYAFEEHKNKLDSISKNEPVVVYCLGTDCDLSILLGNQLFDMGYKKIYVFFGGWWDWLDANYPTNLTDESN